MISGDLVTANGIGGTLRTSKGAKTVIQYLPLGEHKIDARVNGEFATRTVRVEKGIEQIFQADLAAMRKANVPPIIDYMHEGGRAAGHPVGFSWDDQRGLLLEVEWTKAGKQTIEDRELEFFSPQFLLDEDGRPLGLHPGHKPIGGLVSDPAFETIESVAAQKAAKRTTQQPNKPTMDLTELVNLGLVTAEQAKDPASAIGIIATKVAGLQSDQKHKELESALVAAQKAEQDAKAELAQIKEAQADKFVSDHVAAGRIKPKDEEGKTFWRDQYLSNPAVAAKQIEAIPASDLTKPIALASAQREPAPNNEKSMYEEAREMVQAGKAKTFHDAFKSLGVDRYNDYRTSLGLGPEGAAQSNLIKSAVAAALQQHN